MLELKHVTKYIQSGEKKLRILSDVSFSAVVGSFVLINGRSGAGKTTLLNCISGISEIDNGEIVLDGHNLAAESLTIRTKLRLEKMGMVYQSFNFLPGLTIYENCIVPALLLGSTKADYDRCFTKWATAFSVETLGNRMPSDVSGGELQRAAIVRALINSPKIILADEPSGNLDTRNRDIIFNAFLDIVQQQDVLVLMTSHDPIAQEMADVMYVLEDGICKDNASK